MSRRTAAELALAGNTIVWGATFVLVKAALQDVTPILFVALRFGLAAAVLLLTFGARARRQLTPRSLAVGALAGTFLFAGYFFQTLGLRLTTAPKSAFITGLASVMVPLLASLVYRIRPQMSEWMGVALATAGLALMTLEGNLGAIGAATYSRFSAPWPSPATCSRSADFRQLWALNCSQPCRCLRLQSGHRCCSAPWSSRTWSGVRPSCTRYS